jgi:hypothetical protein
MAIGGRDVTVEIDEAAISLFCREDAAVLHDLQGRAERVTQEAKRLAPVSPHGSNGRPSGYLRSEIRYSLGSDSLGAYADVESPATTPTDEPYGLFQEVGTSKMAAQPHLRPALDVVDHE